MPADKSPRTVVIGAGIGGLTTAALLLKAGHQVTVLEAHIYPGGSAGTFFHKGYRFDAGATLAGGFAPGGPHDRIRQLLGLEFPVSPADPAWAVHVGSKQIVQYADRRRWQAERTQQFPGTESFWRTQERLAEAAWQVSAGNFPWPPVSLRNWWQLAAAVRPALIAAAPYALQPVAAMFPRTVDPLFRTFIDTQLLISAQTTAQSANALYGSAALDLPRRGVNHVHGGIGTLAVVLANWITHHGGKVLYRQPVERIVTHDGRAVAVQTRRGDEFPCDVLVANVTPAALNDLLGEQSPGSLQREVQQRRPGWGAFTLYLGVEFAALPPMQAQHHQVVVDAGKPLGEGNSVFISISDAKDDTRAPVGQRAVTLSTHTIAADWWNLQSADPQAYQARREDYTQRVLDAAELALPGLKAAVRLCLPGTPQTFWFYTRRPQGMVGGYPQTSLLAVRGPSTGLRNAWLVGDSIFPGQSTAGVTLGALRVAGDVVGEQLGRQIISS